MTTKLTYAISCTPNLEIGADVTLILIASNNTSDPIKVSQLAFSISVGSLAQDLTTDITGITTKAVLDPDPDDPTPTPSWNIKLDNEEGTFIATIETLPDQDSKIGARALKFTFSGIKVNNAIGTTNFIITETIDGKDYSTELPLSKFPVGFHVTNFHADPYIINSGECTTLSWHGDEKWKYRLDYNSIQKTLDSRSRSFPVNNLTDTTTFFLNVEAESEDLSHSVSLQIATTVIVTNPEIISFGEINGRYSALPGGAILLAWKTKNAIEGYITSSRGAIWDIALGYLGQGQMFIDVPKDKDKDIETFTLSILGIGSQAPIKKDKMNILQINQQITIQIHDPKIIRENIKDIRNDLDIQLISTHSKIDLPTDFQDNALPMAIASDGSKKYLAERSGNKISVLDTLSNTYTNYIEGFYGIKSMFITPDGSKLYVQNSQNTYSVVDIPPTYTKLKYNINVERLQINKAVNLILTVSNPQRESIKLKNFIIKILIGDTEKTLTNNIKGITTTPPINWTLTLPNKLGISTATPQAPEISPQSQLEFKLNNIIINTKAGKVILLIKETTLLKEKEIEAFESLLLEKYQEEMENN